MTLRTHAIRIHQPGGPDALTWDEMDLPEPGPGEARVRHTAVGLNYIDTYHRSGLYPLPLPSVLGGEGAGVVEAVGPGVTDVSVGDRVCYGAAPIGSYSEQRNILVSRLIRTPDDIDDRTAAAAMLKGMTAEYLVRRTYPVRSGDRVLVHAAAGGVGTLLCQWAASLGAVVIGTVGSAEKVAIARESGCAHVIDSASETLAARVREITSGVGVRVVYDGVGRDTFMASLDCLAPRGMMVTFGNASGKPPALDLLTLSTKGSLYVTRPTLATYVAARDELLESAHAVFDVLQRGVVKVRIGQTYPLHDVANAHRDLEGRRTSGATVLLP